MNKKSGGNARTNSPKSCFVAKQRLRQKKKAVTSFFLLTMETQRQHGTCLAKIEAERSLLHKNKQQKKQGE